MEYVLDTTKPISVTLAGSVKLLNCMHLTLSHATASNLSDVETTSSVAET